MFADVTVIVHGALDTTGRFHDYLRLDEYVKQVEESALADEYPTEIYIVYHDHSEDVEECNCVEYVIDMHPDYSWNIEEGESDG